MIQKNNMMRTDLVVRNITVSLGEMLKKKNRIRGTELEQGRPQEIALEAGWKAVIRPLSGRPYSRLPRRGCHFNSLPWDRRHEGSSGSKRVLLAENRGERFANDQGHM
jgi:hypothetical protein